VPGTTEKYSSWAKRGKFKAGESKGLNRIGKLHLDPKKGHLAGVRERGFCGGQEDYRKDFGGKLNCSSLKKMASDWEGWRLDGKMRCYEVAQEPQVFRIYRKKI